MFASFLSQKRMNPQNPEAAQVHSGSALARMFNLMSAGVRSRPPRNSTRRRYVASSSQIFKHIRDDGI